MAGITYTIVDTETGLLKGPFHIEQYNDTKSRLFHHVDAAGIYKPSSKGDSIHKIQILGGDLTDSTAVIVTNLEGKQDTLILLEGTVVDGPFSQVEVIDNTTTTSTMDKITYWESA